MKPGTKLQKQSKFKRVNLGTQFNWKQGWNFKKNNRNSKVNSRWVWNKIKDQDEKWAKLRGWFKT